MPTKPKVSPQHITELPQEEQTVFLAGQFGELSERIEKVEGMTGELANRVSGVEGKVDMLQKAIQQNSQMAAENNLMLHKVLLAIQGQRDPGLEVPGLTQRFKSLEEAREKELADGKVLREQDCAKIQSLESFKNKVLWTLGGAGAVLTFLLWEASPYIIKVLALLK